MFFAFFLIDIVESCIFFILNSQISYESILQINFIISRRIGQSESRRHICFLIFKNKFEVNKSIKILIWIKSIFIFQ